MSSISPMTHLLKLYKILMIESLEKSIPTQTKEIFKSDFIPGSCVFCDLKNNNKSMHIKYNKNGNVENYTDMLLECFNIKLIGVQDNHKTAEICEVCVCRLRDALAFRKHVEAINECLYQDLPKVNSLIKPEDIINKSNVKIFSIEKENSTKAERMKPTKRKEEINLNKLKNNNEDDFNFEGENFEYDNNSTPHVDEEFWKIDHKPSTTTAFKTLNIIAKKEKLNIPALDPFATSCPVCGESFSVHRSLSRHYPIHFPNYLCDICGRAFLRIKNLLMHKTTHSTKKHPCKTCNKIYSHPQALWQHVRKVHQGVKIYCCTVCPERFSDNGTRNKHISQEHGLPVRTYPCGLCKKIFYKSGPLSEHVRRYHLKQKPNICAICSSDFFSKTQLNEHMLKHTGIKIFECKTCGKSYARRKTLIEHMKIHANLRLHKCEVCKKAFIQKCTLKGHMKTHQK